MKDNLEMRNEKILAATRKLRQLNCELRKRIIELETERDMLKSNLENMSFTMMQNDEATAKVLQANQYLAGQLEVYKRVYGDISTGESDKDAISEK